MFLPENVQYCIIMIDIKFSHRTLESAQRHILLGLDVVEDNNVCQNVPDISCQ